MNKIIGDIKMFFKKKETKIERLNRIIHEKIVPIYTKYNENAINFKQDNPYFNHNRENMLYLGKSSFTKRVTEGHGFALYPINDIELYKCSTNKSLEIVVRSAIPNGLLEYNQTDEDIANNLFLLFNEMFETIKTESGIDPTTPFLGKYYFKLHYPRQDYVNELQNHTGYEIRAYHHSFLIDDFKKA